MNNDSPNIKTTNTNSDTNDNDDDVNDNNNDDAMGCSKSHAPTNTVCSNCRAPQLHISSNSGHSGNNNKKKQLQLQTPAATEP